MYWGMTRTLLLIALLAVGATQAQAGDLYRVELLLFERIHGEAELESADAPPERPDHGLPLWVNTGWTPELGAEAALDNESQAILKTPDILALPQNGLRLGAIARTLRNDSDYRLLALTGWHNALPPGYCSVPLVVDLIAGDDGEHRIRGSLKLDRRRYLHLDANLARMKAVEPRFRVAPIPVPEITYPGMGIIQRSLFPKDFLYPETEKHWVTETWLRELRRMRSEEIHYLDAPTFGLIVYFHPITRNESD